MNQVSLDNLMDKVDSRYTLVVIAAKRARMLTERKDNEKDKEEGPAKKKPVTVALEEIMAGKIAYRRTRQGIK
ncbi:MAG: DNA-directed RNA polymerase subunit omega [Bacillota bacterium]|uniref:DNA-directed RNA polymerase subunit omega n=1 Tax=Desulfurispora thermophila TaxID=265470 RepID=UPI00037577BC|nr:DNA-directed RNA polymerase subunit omega [Desulfurispora thermophila]